MPTVKRQTGIKIVNDDFVLLSHALGETKEAIQEATRSLQAKDLIAFHETEGHPVAKEISIFPGAAQRELSPLERKIAYHLLHYTLLDPKHPAIVSAEGICGGEPVIAGTRVPVRTIALYFLKGIGTKDISQEIPHLTEKEIWGAFHYYLDHKEEIEKYIEENSLEKVF